MDPRWTPGIGDPSATGWITVAAYLIAALACLNVARRGRGAATGPFRFWLALSLVLFFLCVNKQLDLQSLFTQLLRDNARAYGWYAERRHFQTAFIFAIGAAGAVALLVLPWRLRAQDKAQNIALCGTIFLYAFIVIRAASFHHVDLALNHAYLMVKLNGLVEIGGIATVLWGAVLARTRLAKAGR